MKSISDIGVLAFMAYLDINTFVRKKQLQRVYLTRAGLCYLEVTSAEYRGRPGIIGATH
jgi:hypothetical protein